MKKTEKIRRKNGRQHEYNDRVSDGHTEEGACVLLEEWDGEDSKITIWVAKIPKIQLHWGDACSLLKGLREVIECPLKPLKPSR